MVVLLVRFRFGYFSYDIGFYYDYPGMTDENTALGQRNVDFFEYYTSVGLAVPNLSQTLASPTTTTATIGFSS